jgi:hypothetical protein
MGSDVRRVKRERANGGESQPEWRPRMTYRIAFPLLALLVAGGCRGSDATDPKGHDMLPGVRLSAGESSQEAGVTEFTFEKWFTTYPAMTGNTSFGPGTFAGTIRSRIPFDNGVIVKLEALYQVTDPNGSHSFTALIQGTENLETMTAVLNGVITDGWRIGARVHVTFDVITPCPIHNRTTCFQGTIRIQE